MQVNSTSFLRGVTSIFFDLDNTLVPTRRADERALKELKVMLWKQWGIPETVGHKICDQFLCKFRQCPDNPNVELDRWRTLLWASALDQEYQDLAEEIYPVWKRLRYTYLNFDAAVLTMLHQLREQYTVALITNGPSRSQWEKIEKMNAEKLFDSILVSGDLPCEKPEAEIFHLACRQLHVSPDQCIMVGDRLETDIAGGKRAGLAATVWIPLADRNNQKTSESLLKCPPDFTIHNVLDLAPMLGLPL